MNPHQPNPMLESILSSARASRPPAAAEFSQEDCKPWNVAKEPPDEAWHRMKVEAKEDE